jgi:hypothetical protein
MSRYVHKIEISLVGIMTVGNTTSSSTVAQKEVPTLLLSPQGLDYSSGRLLMSLGVLGLSEIVLMDATVDQVSKPVGNSRH